MTRISIAQGSDFHHLDNSRFVLKKGAQGDDYELCVLDKKDWSKKRPSDEIDNLGKIIKLFKEAVIDHGTNEEINAVAGRLNAAAKKHNDRFKNVQWLKYLFIPWVLAKIFHWSIFTKYEQIRMRGKDEIFEQLLRAAEEEEARAAAVPLPFDVAELVEEGIVTDADAFKEKLNFLRKQINALIIGTVKERTGKQDLFELDKNGQQLPIKFDLNSSSNTCFNKQAHPQEVGGIIMSYLIAHFQGLATHFKRYERSISIILKPDAHQRLLKS